MIRAFLMSFGIGNQGRLETDLTGSGKIGPRGVEHSTSAVARSTPSVAARTDGRFTLTDTIEATEDPDAAVYVMMSKAWGTWAALG